MQKKLPKFVTLIRAARIVAPIADEHQQSYFEGGVFLILRMLAEFPIDVRADTRMPELPELKRFAATPLSQAWFATINDGPWQSSYDSLTSERHFPAQEFLNWAKSELLVSRDDVIRHLRPPSSPGHEPVAHCNASGARWSFPQVLAWAATRDPTEVARIDSVEHFKKPIKQERIPAGSVVGPRDQGARMPPATEGDLLPRSAMRQSEEGRRKLVGWLAIVTAREHCKCGAVPDAEKEPWESCQCLGIAYDEVRRFGPIAAHPIPKYQPQPEFGSFGLEWSDETCTAGAYRSDVLNQWPEYVATKHLRSSPPIVRRGRPKGSGSLAELDAPLVERMRHLIEQKEALSPTAAAKMIVGEARGGGTEESTISRLVKRYQNTERN